MMAGSFLWFAHIGMVDPSTVGKKRYTCIWTFQTL